MEKTLGLIALLQVKAESWGTSGRQYCSKDKWIGRGIIGERQGLENEMMQVWQSLV